MFTIARGLLGAAILVAGCAFSGGDPTPATRVERPHVVEAGRDGFHLEWRIDSPRPDSADALTLVATLVYRGPEPRVQAWAGFDLVEFYLEQPGGTLRLEPTIEAIGICHEIERGVPITIPYRKSGTFAQPGDPDFALVKEFLGDPELRFPPGRWRITARAAFDIGCEDGRRFTLDATGEILVAP